MYLSPELEITLEELEFLGFTAAEAGTFSNYLNSELNMTTNTLAMYNIHGQYAARLLYMKKLHTAGELTSESAKSFSFLEKHFRKMSGDTSMGVLNLPVVDPIPIYQKAIVSGIGDEYLGVLNSRKGEPIKLHRVVSANASKVVIQVHRKVGLKIPKGYQAAKGKFTKIQNVLEVQKYYTPEESRDYFARIAVNMTYARLINQYVIIAGQKEPQGHLGCAKCVTSQGKILYVYAKPLYNTAKPGNAHNERIYALDHNISNIGKHINRVLEMIEKTLVEGRWKFQIKLRENFPAEIEDYKMVPLTESEKQKIVQDHEEEW